MAPSEGEPATGRNWARRLAGRASSGRVLVLVAAGMKRSLLWSQLGGKLSNVCTYLEDLHLLFTLLFRHGLRRRGCPLDQYIGLGTQSEPNIVGRVGRIHYQNFIALLGEILPGHWMKTTYSRGNVCDPRLASW